MMLTRKILTLLCLMAVTFVPLQAQAKMNCSKNIEQSIIHLEVLTDSYNHGELEYDVYIELVEKIDREVEHKLIECKSRHFKKKNFIADIFGDDSVFYKFLSNLSQNYKKARDELLNGTERVD